MMLELFGFVSMDFKWIFCAMKLFFGIFFSNEIYIYLKYFHNNKGKEGKGKERKGQDRKGKEKKGKERKGKGREREGKEG